MPLSFIQVDTKWIPKKNTEVASYNSCQKQSRNLSGFERISKKIVLKPVRFLQIRIRAKKIQKTSVKSEEILVFDLAARAVFGQSPLLEKN